MREKLLTSLTLFIGLSSTVILVFLNKDLSLYLKLLFFSLLFILYSYKLQKFNILLFLALGSIAVGEVILSDGMIHNASYIILMYGLFFAFASLLIMPIIRKAKIQAKNIDLATVVIGGTTFIFIVVSIFLLGTQTFGNYFLFSIGTISFCLFVMSCLYISSLYEIDKSFYLFMVGIGYIFYCAGTILYETIFPSIYILITVNLVEIIASLLFVRFLIHFSKIENTQKSLV